MFSHVKEFLDEFVRRGIPGMDILVYQNGREVFREMRGVSDEAGTPVRGDERYNIYSCSKVLTCTAAMLLVEEGKLSLDDEVALYLPAFGDMRVLHAGALVKAERRITVRHLFTMTAGLNYSTDSEEIQAGQRETEGKCPTVPMMDYIARMPLEFEPGELWNYSLCHDVLAAVVEVVSGMRFGAFLDSRIFAPLGMKQTTFLLPEEELSTLSAQYRYQNGTFQNVGRKIQSYKLGTLYESGGAGAISSVNDYMRFLEGLRTGKILCEDTLALMRTDLLLDSQTERCWVVGDGYGYGLGIRTPRGSGSLRTDYGWGGAAGAFLAIDPVHEISVYYAQHVLTSPNNALRKDLIEAVKLDLGFEADTGGMWHGRGNRLA